MKKITKTLITVVCLAALCLGAFALTACKDDEKAKVGEAYAITHSKDYVGYAKITVKGDKVTDLVLTEVCLPSHMNFTATGADMATAAAALPAKPQGMTDDDFAVVWDETNQKITAYYKTISYGSVEMTFDTTAKTYKVGTQTILEHLATEANCKAYYEAVIGNQIKVKAGENWKTDLPAAAGLTKATLSKEENGYWTRKDKDNNDYSRWKWNRDNTVAYVKANGVSALSSLTKPTDANVKDPADADVKAWVDSNGVVTGATWNDLNKENPNGYITYVQLIKKAYDAAK